MIMQSRHLYSLSGLTLLVMAVAIVWGIAIDVTAGTGSIPYGVGIGVLGLGLLVLAASGETNRRRLIGIRLSLVAYTALTAGFVIATIGLAVAGASLSGAEREVPGSFGGLVYQVGNGLSGLGIIMGLFAAGFTAWAYLTTRHSN